MKIHAKYSNTENTSVTEGTACCTPTSASPSKSEDPCCEQPTDGSSCCDKTLSKDENSTKTGCC